MSLNEFPTLDPDPGSVVDAEVVVSDDVLVKAFALGPGARIDPHEHDGCSNVFHVVTGTVTVIQEDREEAVAAPGVVFNERGVAHGARNDTEELAVLTASLCPMPG